MIGFAVLLLFLLEKRGLLGFKLLKYCFCLFVLLLLFFVFVCFFVGYRDITQFNH